MVVLWFPKLNQYSSEGFEFSANGELYLDDAFSASTVLQIQKMGHLCKRNSILEINILVVYIIYFSCKNITLFPLILTWSQHIIPWFTVYVIKQFHALWL